jgi:hypothetical protein
VFGTLPTGIGVQERTRLPKGKVVTCMYLESGSIISLQRNDLGTPYTVPHTLYRVISDSFHWQNRAHATTDVLRYIHRIATLSLDGSSPSMLSMMKRIETKRHVPSTIFCLL